MAPKKPAGKKPSGGREGVRRTGKKKGAPSSPTLKKQPSFKRADSVVSSFEQDDMQPVEVRLGTARKRTTPTPPLLL